MHVTVVTRPNTDVPLVFLIFSLRKICHKVAMYSNESLLKIQGEKKLRQSGQRIHFTVKTKEIRINYQSLSL